MALGEYYEGLDIGFTAGESITKGQVAALNDSDPTVADIAVVANAKRVIGVFMEDADEGKPVTVRMHGVAEVLVSEEIVVGDILAAGVAGGKAKKYVSGATNYGLGKSLGSAVADGYVAVLLALLSTLPADTDEWTRDGTAVRPANAGDSLQTDDPAAEASVLELDDNIIEGKGTETNVDIELKPKGAGAVSVGEVVDYENNVTEDDDLPNKKYVDDAIAGNWTEGTTDGSGQITVTGMTASGEVALIPVTDPGTGLVIQYAEPGTDLITVKTVSSDGTEAAAASGVKVLYKVISTGA